MFRKIVIGNWKSNMQRQDLNNYLEFIGAESFLYNDINIYLAVPAIFLNEVKRYSCNRYRYYKTLSQSISSKEYGSNTGTLSYQHLIDFGIDGSIVGHNETYADKSTTNEEYAQISQKLTSNDMKSVYCIGETTEIYKKNKTTEFLIEKLSWDLRFLKKENIKNLIIAYEPIWAVGTGLTPSNEYISEVIKTIRNFLNSKFNLQCPIIYGGSVTSDNIFSFCVNQDLDGFMIGTPSIDIKEFSKILGSVSQWQKLQNQNH